MTDTTAVWSADVVLRAPATLGASASVDVAIDMADLEASGRGSLEAEINVTFVKGSASSATFLLVGRTGDTDGVSWNWSANAGRTVAISGPARVLRITNNDGSNPTGNIGVTMRWMKADTR